MKATYDQLLALSCNFKSSPNGAQKAERPTPHVPSPQLFTRFPVSSQKCLDGLQTDEFTPCRGASVQTSATTDDILHDFQVREMQGGALPVRGSPGCSRTAPHVLE